MKETNIKYEKGNLWTTQEKDGLFHVYANGITHSKRITMFATIKRAITFMDKNHHKYPYPY